MTSNDAVQGCGRLVLLLFMLWGLVAPANAATLVFTNSDPANIDGNLMNPVLRPFIVDKGGTVRDVNVIVNFAKADGETFEPPFDGWGSPFFNEIGIRLVSPGGISVDLISVGSLGAGSAPGFDGTIRFDDAAPTRLDHNPEYLVPGTFRPTGPGSLSDFIGVAAQGTWVLELVDSGWGDSFRFRSASLVIAETPEPGTFALLGLGCGGVLLARRIRRRV